MAFHRMHNGWDALTEFCLHGALQILMDTHRWLISEVIEFYALLQILDELLSVKQQDMLCKAVSLLLYPDRMVKSTRDALGEQQLANWFLCYLMLGNVR